MPSGNYHLFSSKLAPETVSTESISDSTLLDNIGAVAEVGSVSFPVEFIKEQDGAGEQNTASAVYSSGNIECWGLKANIPYLGVEFPTLPVQPIAKAEGQCKYIHTVGTPPPLIGFELRQVLAQYRVIKDPIFGRDKTKQAAQWTRSHHRQGLAARWWSNGNHYTEALAFGSCPRLAETDLYTHSFAIYITPPYGWQYKGPKPLAMAPNRTSNLISCR